jgi:hypothetical protein
MPRHNDIWPFLARIAPCVQCGAQNRVYIDDARLAAVCGRCQAAIPPQVIQRAEIDWAKIVSNEHGMPLPPRGIRWWHRLGREVNALLEYGSFRSSDDRRAERNRFAAACEVHANLCHKIAEKRASEEKVKREREVEAACRSKREQDEALRRAAEAERLRQEALERQEREWRESYAGQLEEQLSKTRYMSGREFELYLGKVFEVCGYTVEVTAASCDQGVDLIITSGEGRRLAIQAKNYTNTVGNKAVQELYTGIACHQCDAGIVITTSSFTRSAEVAAVATQIKLWTLADVQRLLKDKALG